MATSITHRILGGSPLAVLIRLVLVSLLVGALMSWLEIDPAALFDWVRQSVLHLWFTGFRSLQDVGRYIATGAAVVVPVWILLRLTSIGYREPRPKTRVGRWDLPGAPNAGTGASEVRTGGRD